MHKYVIIALTTFSLFLLLRFSGNRNWFQSIKRFPYISTLLILLLFSISFLGGVREGEQEVDTLRIIRIVFIFAIAFFACVDLILSRHNAKPLAPAGAVIWIMFFYAVIAMLSSTYSVYPELSLWKGFETGTHVFVAASVAKRLIDFDDADGVLQILMMFLLFLIVSFLWGAFLYTDLAILREEGVLRIKGIFPTLNSNNAAQFGGMLLVFALFHFCCGWRRYRIGFIATLATIGFTTLALGHSRTALVSTGITILLGAITLKNKTLWLVCVVAVAFFSLSPFIFEAATEFVFRGQTEKQFLNLTGRVNLWSDAIDKISESPIAGYGYYAAHRDFFSVSHLHNSYLTAALGGGFLLLLPLLLATTFLSLFIFVTRPSNDFNSRHNLQYRIVWAQAMTIYIAVLVRSATGPSFEAHHYNLILFLLCAAIVNVLRRFNSAPVVRPKPIE